ncbi:class I SAM-dependent DNA methyltransferase [Frankia sp. AgB32]|uniref:HsdM family class I SAM-dependent methyltransferase n=1 Tax=Frankia sp. AgB32 TaxID=631119 RepID=UPI00200E2BD9|nr:N-6 DNA methylase [Frankia sp. AgB32]MCK9894175.1 SAM-dependent methyltransferase [Frankia sp. AgB32]
MVRHVEFDGQEELTAAAIARRIGVGRAAVSNWRRRYDAFPSPVGGNDTNPTFRWAAVADWLEHSGRAEQLAKAGRTETGTQALDGPTGGWSTRDAFVEQAKRDVEAEQRLARVLVSLLPPTTAASAGGDDLFATADDLPVVFDPACGDGTLLLAAADRFEQRVRLFGQDNDERLARSATLGLRGHPLAGPYDVRLGDSLRGNRFTELLGRAAAVVCEPPFDRPGWPADELATDRRWEFGRPEPRDGELAWVQHCYAHLRPRGTAVIAVSPRACVSPSGQTIRQLMIGGGALRAVIALPAEMSTAAGEACLWVLRRPRGDQDDEPVVLVDFAAADMAAVPHQFGEWRQLFGLAAGAASGGAGRARPGPVPARAVTRARLLQDGEANILPSRYVTTEAQAGADDIARIAGQLEAIYARLGAGLPRYAAAHVRDDFAYVTLAELERAGAVTIRLRGTTPHAGDVLVWPRAPGVLAATGEERTGGMTTHVVELDRARLDPDFVAMFLRPEVEAVPIPRTIGVLGREDLRRCRIPRLSIAEQRHYGAEFRRLSDLRAALTTLARLSTTVIDQTLHGLTAGTLTPDRLAPTTPTHEENL